MSLPHNAGCEMPTDVLKIARLVLALLVLGVLFWSGRAAYLAAQASGMKLVQEQWDEQRRKDAEVSRQIQDKLRTVEESHRRVQQGVADAIAQANEDHLTELSRLRSDYDRRLRQSEARADVYRRQAEGGAPERDDLASHAARLDRQLEEGIHVVGELSALVEQRDRQLILLGQQIKADRELLEETP